MELINFRRYRQPDLDIRFWRTSTGHEVDIILGDMHTAIEVKGSGRVHETDLRGMRALREGHRVQHAVVVCLEKEPRVLDDDIEIVPWQGFLERLWAGWRLANVSHHGTAVAVHRPAG